MKEKSQHTTLPWQKRGFVLWLLRLVSLPSVTWDSNAGYHPRILPSHTVSGNYMKRYQIFLLVILILISFSCDKSASNFPDKVELSSLKESEFIPTLEHTLPRTKNNIYSAALLLAWNEIRKEIKRPINIDPEYIDLVKINKSDSFRNALLENDYKASGSIHDNFINLKAEFNKSLPFRRSLTSYPDRLTFNKEKVYSFGKVRGGDEAQEVITILYYKNDEKFILKLNPKDSEHEIILSKSTKKLETFANHLDHIEKQIPKGQIEKGKKKTEWKYLLSGFDEVLIPKFSFNIEHNYPSLTGSKIRANGEVLEIETVSQRIAFILDEKGAQIESEAEIDLTTEEEELEEKPRPKKMHFNKPFCIILKRKNSDKPYFAMWVSNSELMQKKK